MTVSYTRDQSVAVITIDRPERKNAIDRDTATALTEAIEQFEEEDADVCVLTGANGTFCAGADLQAMNLEDSPDGWLGISRRQVSKPTIAAVEGHCVAGGLELALWCDLRVASQEAVFGCFERRFGVPLVDGATQRLPRVVGVGRALDMILTGRAVDAQEAERWGLVTRVVPEGETREAAVRLGNTIAEFPQKTVRTDRAAVYDGLGVPIEQGLTIEGWHGTQALETAMEGADRFADGEGRSGAGIPDE